MYYLNKINNNKNNFCYDYLNKEAIQIYCIKGHDNLENLFNL